MDIGDRIFDVRCEVWDPSATVWPCQVIIDPADQQFLRWQLHQVFKCLTLLQQSYKSRMILEIDVRQKTDLTNKTQCHCHKKLTKPVQEISKYTNKTPSSTVPQRCHHLQDAHSLKQEHLQCLFETVQCYTQQCYSLTNYDNSISLIQSNITANTATKPIWKDLHYMQVS